MLTHDVFALANLLVVSVSFSFFYIFSFSVLFVCFVRQTKLPVILSRLHVNRLIVFKLTLKDTKTHSLFDEFMPSIVQPESYLFVPR